MASGPSATSMNISTHNLTYCVEEHEILCGLNLVIPSQQVTALIGPNGAGKSTLMRLLAGDEPPSEGKVFYGASKLEELSLANRAKLRSVMTQSSNVVFEFLVEEIISLGWLKKKDELRIAMDEIISLCEVQSLIGRKYITLSGGEQRRVQFARALLQIWSSETEGRPDRFLFLDEPTSSLDVANALQVLNLSRRILEQSVTVVVVLHDLNLAARYADQLILLSNGKAASVGKPSEVLQAARLSEVYGTSFMVEHHKQLDRLVVYS
ncbi:MAG: heme ABC transporter ATP-binding protein [Alphaproteobacteria bacterium]|nr:heme ABC transporter ATP-binding protein [Alphaproteobacteria bacterium]